MFIKARKRLKQKKVYLVLFSLILLVNSMMVTNVLATENQFDQASINLEAEIRDLEDNVDLFRSYLDLITSLNPSDVIWADLPTIDQHINSSKNHAKSWINDLHPQSFQVLGDIINYDGEFNETYDRLVELAETINDGPQVKNEFMEVLTGSQERIEEKMMKVEDVEDVEDVDDSFKRFKMKLSDDRSNFQSESNEPEKKINSLEDEILQHKDEIEVINRKYDEKKYVNECVLFICTPVLVNKYDHSKLDKEKADVNALIKEKEDAIDQLRRAEDQLEDIMASIEGAYLFLDSGFSGVQNQWYSLSLKFNRLIGDCKVFCV